MAPGAGSRLTIAAAAMLVAVSVLIAAPASAVPLPDGRITSVELIPDDGTTFTIDGRTYEGSIRVGAASDGLVISERVSLDQYLSGIREVPFSWPAETLAAQVVAARSYLAWTLRGGRSGNGARYGFDICATSACQVYEGAGLEARDGGARWVAAVRATAGQILMWRGRPAEAVYSASAGERTRSNQDVWGGSPIPYLQAVDSPEDGVSPFASWHIEIPADLFVRVLQREGYAVSGTLESLLVRSPGEGKGITTIWVDTSGGTDSVSAPALKGVLNRQGPDLAPGLLPVRIGRGARLPQALPSYTYDITFRAGDRSALPAFVRSILPSEDRPQPGEVIINGEGWGHGVGMSQWGAKAMGDAGATYQEILAHYYGGLEPTDGGEFVPESVTVGLSWQMGTVDLVSSAAFELRVNGVTIGRLPAGEWTMRRSGSGLTIVGADGLEVSLLGTLIGETRPR